MKLKSVLLEQPAFSRTLKRISHEILEKNDNIEDVCLVGIKTRGVPLANRISECIFQIEGKRIPVGILDITLYRDDLTEISDNPPKAKMSSLPFDVAGKTVILVDDVIYTGRSTRAALDAIISHGRPDRIQVAAFVDRGHRELPIRADYVGKNIPTSRNEVIRVGVSEIDGNDFVELYEK